MPIKVTCACGKKLAVKDELAGKKVTCPVCQKLLSIPEPKVAEESLDDEWDLGGSAEDEPSEAPAKSRGAKSSASRGSVSRKGKATGKGKKSSGSNRGLLIGLSAGGGVLVVALLTWMLWPAAPAANVAGNPPANQEQTPAPASGDATKPINSVPEVADGVQKTLTLNGHTNAICDVAFSPDGNQLASASFDNSVKLWNAKNGQELLTLKGHTDQVRSVAFSTDGKRLVSASVDKTVKVWDATSGQEVLMLKGHTGSVGSVAISTDGKWLATASWDQTVKLWDAMTGQETLTLKPQTSGINCVALSADGKRLASAGERGIKLWDATSGQELLTLKGHTGEVSRVAFSADGKRLVSGSFDKTVKLWDAMSGQELLTLKGHSGPVVDVALSADGKWVASASWDGTVKVWDAANGQETLTSKEHTSQVYCVAFSPDGKRLASGSIDKTVMVWDFSNRISSTGTAQMPPLTSTNLPAKNASEVTGDLKALQGDWHIVDFQQDPPASPITSDGLKLATVTFAGDSMTIVYGSAAPGGRKETTTIKLDASQNPKTIDMTAADGPQKGKTNPGIYSLEGDVLKLHFSESRPTTWTPTKGAKAAVMVMNRGRPPLAQQASDKSVKPLGQLAADSPHTAFFNISDGTANTVFGGMVSESRAVPWTKPDDLVFDDSFQTKENSFVEGAVMFADGSIRHLQIQEGLDRAKFRLLFSINDGQPSPLMSLYPPDHKFAPLIYKSVQDQVRQAEARSENKNSLKAIMLAFFNHHDVFKHFPPAIVYGPDGKPWHSWRVLILPYLGQKELFDQYDASVPWDHPKNAAVLDKMPAVYRDPLADKPSNKTRYLLATGAGTAFPTKPGANAVAQAQEQPAPPKPVAKDGREPIDYQPINLQAWQKKKLTPKFYPWEGEKVVLLTTTADLDPKTIDLFLKRLDAAWTLCGELTGYVPQPFKQYRGKPTIAAIPDPTLTLGASYGAMAIGGGEVSTFDGPQGDYERVRQSPDHFSAHFFQVLAQNHYGYYQSCLAYHEGSMMVLREICLESVKPSEADAKTRRSLDQVADAYSKSNLSIATSFPNLTGSRPMELKDSAGQPLPPTTIGALLGSIVLKLRQEHGGNEWVKRFYRHLSSGPPTVGLDSPAIQAQLLNFTIAASLASQEEPTKDFKDRWRFPFDPAIWASLKKVDWNKPGLNTDQVIDALPIEQLLPTVAMTRPGFLTPERRKQNMLAGGTFEEGSGGTWKVTSWRQNNAAAAVVSGEAKEGRKSVVVRSPLVADDAMYEQTIGVKPNTRYLLSGWIKTKNVVVAEPNGQRGANLSVEGLNGEVSRSLQGTNDWNYVTLVFDSQQRNEVTVRARLGFHYSTAKGEAWFDDLCLIPIGPSPVRLGVQSPPPAPGPAEKDNLLVNGSFEEGPDFPENFGYLPNVRMGSTDIKGWTVTRGSIDVTSSRHWLPGHGQRSIDLHGTPGFGGVKQTFKTVAGQRYQASFLMAGTPLRKQPIHKLAVRAADQQQEFSFDATGKTQFAVGWERKSWEFVAVAAETTLEIHTLETEDVNSGPILDDVSVVAVGVKAPGQPLKAEAEEEPKKSAINWKGWPKDTPPPAISPFDAAQAKQHQEAWAKHLKVPVEYTNSIGMKFRLIPPGEFLMGSTADEVAVWLKQGGLQQYALDGIQIRPRAGASNLSSDANNASPKKTASAPVLNGG